MYLMQPSFPFWNEPDTRAGIGNENRENDLLFLAQRNLHRLEFEQLGIKKERKIDKI